VLEKKSASAITSSLVTLIFKGTGMAMCYFGKMWDIIEYNKFLVKIRYFPDIPPNKARDDIVHHVVNRLCKTLFLVCLRHDGTSWPKWIGIKLKRAKPLH
jgi:hypothetical protein